MTERPLHREAPPATPPLTPAGERVDTTDPRIQAGLDILNQGYEALTTSEGFAEYLRTQARFHKYSFKNTLMIMMQQPDATKVMGYGSKDGSTGWKSVGRQVRKGEKAIKIWRPLTVKDPVEKDERGKPKEIVVGFTIANVFDISQTDGEPLPDPPMPVQLEGNSAFSGRLYDAVRLFVEQEGVTVKREQMTRERANGYFRPSDKHIGISHRIYGEQALKTMAHEAAHYLADHNGNVTPSDAESVAEGAAFVFCHYHGIDTSQYTFPYIAHWAESRDTLLRNTAEIHRVARKLIDGAQVQLDEVVVFDRLPSRDELIPNSVPPHLRKR